ncbi:sigma-70 family RNA polymerase sigma factor [Nocardioides anomalus]|uniref:Sigma-70 family RNA polymerase sigma factor n=1 Tax=Nocardioides anomalus TaxID=2712223 RepID=A0A6G6WJX7_9ACTN|nr:sigma-70 family RNA polymerase sigma factor [Nocardioides anomalus]QIG45395.1 sigma-70 family RNA polymerase sigma factor [Nocardioides anomalus]
MGHAPGEDEPGGERALVDRARRGDPDAWEQLYRRAYPRLVAYARRRLVTEEQAEEAVSETMVRAMDAIGRYRPGAAGLQGWLFGIARNVVLERYRSGSRLRATDPAALAARAAPTHPGPEHAVLDAEERVLLRQAFDRLSPQDQELLELRVVAGLDAEQVGALTGKRAGAVRMAQSRALARLRAELEGLSA